MSYFLALIVIVILAYLFLRHRAGGAVASNQALGSLPGPGTYEFDIVGESKYQAELASICGGKNEDSAQHYAEAFLHLEDSNPFDNLAVRVDIGDKTVGYLSRKDARSFRNQLKELGHERIVCRCNAVVVGGWRKSASNQGHFGVKLDLPVE